MTLTYTDRLENHSSNGRHEVVPELGLPKPTPIGDGCYAQICEITPALAANILEGHHVDNNRKPKKRVVNRYTRDMLNQKWDLTGAPIVFNDKGKLCDGQHRLHACCKSGTPFKTLVVYGVSERGMLNIDKAAPRTMANSVQIAGLDIPGIAIKNLKTVATVNVSGSPDTLSASEQIVAYNAFRGGIDFIAEHFSAKHIRVPVQSAVVRAYYHESSSRLAEFCRCITKSHVPDPVLDSGAAKLLHYLMNPPSNRGTDNQYKTDTFLKTQVAIKAFCERRELKQLRTNGKDTYPVTPEVMAELKRRGFFVI